MDHRVDEGYSKENSEYLKRLSDGALLLSTESLKDPNFEVTVVLVCIYNDEGAFGLVLNRPSHMPLNEVFNSVGDFANERRAIYIGGPVEPEGLHLIQLTEEGAPGSYSIQKDVYLGGEWESIEEILNTDAETTRLFLGYSGWSAGQLEDEIEDGAWEVYNVDLYKFLENWSEPLFHDVESIRKHIKDLVIS